MALHLPTSTRILLTGMLPLLLAFPLFSNDHDSDGYTPAAHSSSVKSETGIASWYGYPYHGRVAASGEVYDMQDLTAAHRTLPFGTRVRVVNLLNEKSVEVRINDRGPFVDGRVIDLSNAAARAIDMVRPGVTPVRLDVIGPALGSPDLPPASMPGAFAVQVGAFQDRRNAERYMAEMRARYGAARLTVRDGDPIMWRVLVGSESTEERARALGTRIRKDTGQKTAFVVRLDPERTTTPSVVASN